MQVQFLSRAQMVLSFQKFVIKNKEVISNWFSSDELGIKFLSSYVTDEFAQLIDFQKRYLWLVLRDDVGVGFFDLEIESDKKGYFAFYIAPAYRGKGLGLEILKAALNLPEVTSVEVLEGGVDKDNLSSIKTLEQANFKYAYTDEDGMLMYQLIQR